MRADRAFQPLLGACFVLSSEMSDASAQKGEMDLTAKLYFLPLSLCQSDLVYGPVDASETFCAPLSLQPSMLQVRYR